MKREMREKQAKHERGARVHLSFAFDELMLRFDSDPDRALRAMIHAALKLREQYDDE